MLQRIRRWLRRSAEQDAGMTTVEYAVGTVVAAALAAVLYKIVTGDSVVSGLTHLVTSALSTVSWSLRRGPSDEGAVTIEAAIGIGSIVMVLVLCLAALGCLVDSLRVTDAAGEAARLAARGDRAGAVAAVAVLGPSGARLDLVINGSSVTAVVSAQPVGGVLPGIRLRAVAVAAAEPQDGDP